MIIVIIITDDNDVLFQVSLSVKRLWLDDVSWWTSDVHSLITSLHLTHLDRLVVFPECKLSPALHLPHPHHGSKWMRHRYKRHSPSTRWWLCYHI